MDPPQEPIGPPPSQRTPPGPPSSQRNPPERPQLYGDPLQQDNTEIPPSLLTPPSPSETPPQIPRVLGSHSNHIGHWGSPGSPPDPTVRWGPSQPPRRPPSPSSTTLKHWGPPHPPTHSFPPSPSRTLPTALGSLSAPPPALPGPPQTPQHWGLTPPGPPQPFQDPPQPLSPPPPLTRMQACVSMPQSSTEVRWGRRCSSPSRGGTILKVVLGYRGRS